MQLIKKGKFITCDYKNHFSGLGKFSMSVCFYADSTQNKMMQHSVYHLFLKMVALPFELMKKQKQANL